MGIYYYKCIACKSTASGFYIASLMLENSFGTSKKGKEIKSIYSSEAKVCKPCAESIAKSVKENKYEKGSLFCSVSRVAADPESSDSE